MSFRPGGAMFETLERPNLHRFSLAECGTGLSRGRCVDPEAHYLRLKETDAWDKEHSVWLNCPPPNKRGTAYVREQLIDVLLRNHFNPEDAAQRLFQLKNVPVMFENGIWHESLSVLPREELYVESRFLLVANQLYGVLA